MRHHLGWIGMALLLSGCASTSASVSRTPVSMVLETAENTQFWEEATQTLAQNVAEYQIRVAAQEGASRLLNRIEEKDGRASVCFAPKTEYDFAGNLLGFTPLYCSALDKSNPVQALDEALQAYQSGYIKVPFEEESDSEFRARILAESTPDNPVCFSVYSELFASGSAVLDLLEENYLIACANRIDGEVLWPHVSSSTLAKWLRVEAALLSNQSLMISSAFRGIASDDSKESNVYGIALEGYTEILAKKQRQAEITGLRALALSDEAENYFLSRQNALLLSHIVSVAETMDGKRLEAIVNALAPKDGWPANVIDVRTILQLRACQMSVIIPDVSASLVSACLPWLRMSVRSEDDFEMALLLIEHGIYGTPEGEPVIEENVLSWLKNVMLDETMSGMRHSFGQRISSVTRLSDEERAVVSGF